MKDIFKNGYVSRIFTARAKRRRIIYIMFMLSVLAAVYVFWTLHRVGIAMTDEILCGKTEHVHSAECLSDINGCEIEEHTHTAECTSDISADIETEEVWTSTLPVSLSDNWRNNVAAIALSQIGYKESVRNFTLADNGEKKGYTRYGQWYGNPYGDWDTMFVYFCMFYAGIDTDNIPYGSGCSVWAETLAENGMFIPADIGKPLNGDVCFLDTDKDGTIDKTAVVTGSEETDPGFTIRTAEGDVNGEVAETSYLWDDGRIVGFLSLEQPDMISSGNNIEYSCSLPEDSEDISDDEYAEILPEEDEYILGISEPLTDDYAGYSAYMDNSVTYLANENERCVYLNGYLNGNYNPDSNGNTIIDIKSGQNVNIYVKLYLKKSDTDNSHPYNYYEQISEAVYNENKHKWNYFKHGENYYYFKAAIWNDTDDGTTTKFELYDSDYISYSSFYFQTEGSEEIIMLRQTVTGITLDAGSNSKRYLFKYNRCDSGVPTERFYIRVNPTKINITSPEQEANTYQEKGTPYQIAKESSITMYAVTKYDTSNYTEYPDEAAFNAARAANNDETLQFLRTSTGEYISTYARFWDYGERIDGSGAWGSEDPRATRTYLKYVPDTANNKLMITVTYKITDDRRLVNKDGTNIELSPYHIVEFSGVQGYDHKEQLWLNIMPPEDTNDGSDFKIISPISAPCSNYAAGNPYGSDGTFESRKSITLQCVTPYFEKISESDYNDLPANKRDQYKKVTDPDNENSFFYIKTEANIWANNVLNNENGEIVDTLVTKGTVTYRVVDKLLYVDIIYTAKELLGSADAKITYFSGIPVNINQRERYYKYFYLRVSEPTYTAYPIYVKTEGDVWKDKDMITEYSSYIWVKPDDERINEYGYIKNTNMFPYIVYVENNAAIDPEPKLEIYFPRKYSPVDNSEVNSPVGDFELVSVDGYPINIFPHSDSGGNEGVKVMLDKSENTLKYMDTNGDGEKDAIYKCYYINKDYLNDTYKDEVTVKIDYCFKYESELPTENPGDTPQNQLVTETLSSIYVKLYPRGGKNSYTGDDGLTHCDIEIEEGGLYTFNKREVNPSNGQKYDVIESYEAVISGVKGCKVYGKDGNPVKFFLEDQQTYNEAANAEFKESDYASSGIKGSTQFEFTSAFYPGTKLARSDYFLKKDVYRVDFVVQITLTPYKRTTIVYNDDGTIQSTRQDSFGGKPLIVNDVAVSMDHNSVSDALNKCPLHNGLDFTYVGDLKQTVEINDSNTSVKVYKKLENSEIQKNQFSFLITDLLTGDEFTVKNRALGADVSADIAEQGLTLVQLMQHYTDEGTYSFTIREIIPEDTKGIIYCKDVYQMDIIVTYDDANKRFRYTPKYYNSDGVQIPSIPVFVNTFALYELPSTGGTGTIIYYVTGGVLIIVPVLILIRRKRKER